MGVNYQAELDPVSPTSPLIHSALHVDQDTQADMEARIAAAGIVEPQTYVLEHGYCRSVYVTDPNGMILEFTYDAPQALDPALDAARRASAHADLKRWLAGDHSNNNHFRTAA